MIDQMLAMKLQANQLDSSSLESKPVLEIDGRLKAEFATKEGAEQGALELKRCFPMLQVRLYDAAAKVRHEISAG